MRAAKTNSTPKKTALENLAENLTGMKYKRIQVRNRQYIRNLLKTNQQLLKDHHVNSLILF